jgi:hypothetical protein
MELKTCPECGVPEVITSENLWLDNGDIVQKRSESSRMIFIETENLDPVFHSLEEIIGASVERVVIAAGRRTNRAFLRTFVDRETRERIQRKEMEYTPVMESMFALARLLGVGNYQLLDLRYEKDDNDYNNVRISEPFSIPMNIAAHVGDVELLTGVDQGYAYEQVSPGECDIHVFPSPHSEGLEKRMWITPYSHEDGGLELEKCATCGGPTLLSGHQWFPKRGVIINKTTRRRMVIQGNALLDPVFEELETELGDTIPRAVVEAQRRFTRSGFYTAADLLDVKGFRNRLALMGVGNIKELEMKKKGMRMLVENIALPLIVIGQAQGFFELGFDTDSTVDWELTEERTMEMEVKPRAPSK